MNLSSKNKKVVAAIVTVLLLGLQTTLNDGVVSVDESLGMVSALIATLISSLVPSLRAGVGRVVRSGLMAAAAVVTAVASTWHGGLTASEIVFITTQIALALGIYVVGNEEKV